jgi:hypothetical protein
LGLRTFFALTTGGLSSELAYYLIIDLMGECETKTGDSLRYVVPDERVTLAKQILEFLACILTRPNKPDPQATESVVIVAAKLLESFLSEDQPNPAMLEAARRRCEVLRTLSESQKGEK